METISNKDLARYNELKTQGYTTLWVGNGLICLIKSA